MKGAISSVLASAFLLSVGAGIAHAEKPKRAVVEQFSGTGADKFRKLVQAELAKQGIELISDKKRAATEADLGLLQVSDNYAAFAKELKVDAFIDGTVTGSKKLTARLKVKGPDGAAQGGASWVGANEKKLLNTIDDTLSKKLAAVFAGGGAAAKEEAAPVAEAAAKPGKTEEVAEEKPRKKKKAESEESEAPKADAEEEASVSASVDEDDGPPSAHKKLDVAVGAHVYGRKFSYNQSVLGDQRGYNLPVVSAPSISLDYFFLPYLGISASAEYSLALISEDGNGDRYRTSSFGYSVGLKGRYALGERSEVTGGLGYASNNFKVTPEADDKTPPQVAGVDYGQLRAGVGGRFGLTDTVSVLIGGSYLHLLSMGELQSKDYFEFATGRGGEGYGGIAIALPWVSGLEARLTADIRRYVFSMNSTNEDKFRRAGGATDQYIGANIAVGFRQ